MSNDWRRRNSWMISFMSAAASTAAAGVPTQPKYGRLDSSSSSGGRTVAMGERENVWWRQGRTWPARLRWKMARPWPLTNAAMKGGGHITRILSDLSFYRRSANQRPAQSECLCSDTPPPSVIREDEESRREESEIDRYDAGSAKRWDFGTALLPPFSSDLVHEAARASRTSKQQPDAAMEASKLKTICRAEG